MTVGRRLAIDQFTDDFTESLEALPPGERNRSFSGRSRELKTAPNDAETPVACFMACLPWRLLLRDAPSPPGEGRSQMILDTAGS